MHGGAIVSHFLNSDAWANWFPVGLLAALMLAVALGGCAENPIGGKSLKQFWDGLDRDHYSRPARRP